MDIEFSDHAKERNLRRKIPKNRIIQTIKNPSELLGSSRGRKLRRKKFGNKTLEVVTITEGSKIIIITQYYL